ncbi:MAG: response regulator [Anaerolineaceae bacterium]|nr:response regulator [Anaerolineaceae bacterium]
MHIKISTKLIAVLLCTTLIPLLLAGIIGYNNSLRLREIATESSQNVASLAMTDSMAALTREKQLDLNHHTGAIAGDINEVLARVAADTAELAAYATFLYNHPDSYGRYPHTTTYTYAANGSFGSQAPNENSWLVASTLGLDAQGQASQALLDEIHLTEFMDVKFRSIAHSNPYAVQLYLNTSSQLSRGMPFIDNDYLWIDATEQFPSDMDLSSFDFFFLADATHNPTRQPVWTELYWDPAGLGWMVSCVAPVYVGDQLKGVVGIDITLGKMIDEILNVQVEQTGFAFLMSDQGQAIAFPERASRFLGFQGSLSGDFGNDEEFAFFLNESEDENFLQLIQAMIAGETNLTTYTAGAEETDTSYFFAYHPVEVTHWSVGIVVPVSEVIAPALQTNVKIEQNTAETAVVIQERSHDFITKFLLTLGGIVLLVVPLALLFSRSISTPIHQLEEGTRKFGAGELEHRIVVHSGDEIEDLAKTFNQMADDLQHNIGEIATANAELKKLDALKSQFISMASHELRTPLIAIKGYVELLQDGNAGPVNDEQQQMLKTVSRNTVRLARIVTELLDLSRIEENKLALHPEPFDVAQLLHEIALEQKPTLDRRHHSLVIEAPANLPPLVGDQDRISQVLINLLGNAIKYTPDGGQITITAHAEANKLHLTVQDNGVGIQPEHQDKIFSRFYTAGDLSKHKTGKDSFMAGGSGLGLPIVKGIVEAHQGEVWVESVYGEGSTFHVRLPFAAAAEAAETAVSPTPIYKATKFSHAAPEAEAAIYSNGHTKILIIDDETAAIDITERMLADHYQVITAHTSATGLKAAMQDHPNLILLDAWLPGISGYDVCKTLKANKTTQHIPIIIFTAATQQADEAQAQASGADGFITKPFQKSDLLHLIEGFKKDA